MFLVSTRGDNLKKILLTKDKSSLFILKLLNDDDLVGNITIYPYKSNQGILDLYIEEKWRCRWLTKSFGKFLLQMLIETCKDFNIKILITRLNNVKSLRLLDYFNFVKYNERYFYLLI